MNKLKLFNNEVFAIDINDCTKNKLSDDEINNKYERGFCRIITENGALKLGLIVDTFKTNKYTLRPEFQRRITWDDTKRSKLIESFIMNIPIPPVFIYEKDFDNYEVMDGLQRLSAIISFYKDEFLLKDLTEWPELNGKSYSQLPSKIKEGIDRRQITTVTLLKESTSDIMKADEIKKVVFERLNTGGVKLEPQEIRNALYNGPFNILCNELSNHNTFKELFWIGLSDIALKDDLKEVVDDFNLQNENESYKTSQDRLYRRMYDVELVLRFFAMRHYEEFSGTLDSFLDNYLYIANKYDENLRGELSNQFQDIMFLAKKMFGVRAFCFYRKRNNSDVWTRPLRTIYDPMCRALTIYKDKIDIEKQNIDENCEKLKNFYYKNFKKFNAKHQSKMLTLERMNLMSAFIKKFTDIK